MNFFINLLFIGVNGFDGDGDITKPENIEEFKQYVHDCTDGQGVHFVMADGVSVYRYMYWMKARCLLSGKFADFDTFDLKF